MINKLINKTVIFGTNVQLKSSNDIIRTIGTLLQFVVGAVGAFYVVIGLISVVLTFSNDNPNAKDQAYMKLATGMALLAVAVLIPTVLSTLMPTISTVFTIFGV